MSNKKVHMGGNPRLVPGERRGLGFFSSIAVFVFLCCLSGSLLVASIGASNRPVGPIVNIDQITHLIGSEADSSGQKPSDQSAGTDKGSDASGKSEQKVVNGQDAGQASDESTDEGKAPVVDEAELKKGYYYNQLDDGDKNKYATIYRMLSTREKVTYPNNDVNDIRRIFNFVLGDHPEIFYSGTFSYATGSNSSSSIVEGSYCYSESKINELTERLETVVGECVAGVPANADDFTKAKYVYDYMVSNTTYSFEIFNNMNSLPFEQAGQNAISSLVEKQAVCSGYARGYQLIMQRLGLTCAFVEGDLTKEGSRHAWCLVELDGEFYYVDPTWGDHDSNTKDESVHSWAWSNYGYLCIDTDDVHRSRNADDYQPLPDCSARADNYYVRANLMLETAELNKILEWGNAAIANGERHFQFRCADKAVYDQVFNAIGSMEFNGNPSYRYWYHDDVFVFEVLFK